MDIEDIKQQPVIFKLAALFEAYEVEEISQDLDDLLYVLVEYARLHPASVEALPNRYYLLRILRDFFREQIKK